MKSSQLTSIEQESTLAFFAQAAATQNCSFLEIGSWQGDSTVILGHVARQHNGRIYCIDWWKGNIGTELEQEAKSTDVFAFFWERIRSEGLEDVVIPIRTRSEIVRSMLKENTMDLVFIDGDHRFESARSDIILYAPLVRDGGILSGHDCEGRRADFERTFLDKGKDIDIYEGVHCGVVLAVGEFFRKYSVNHSIWSVCSEKGAWVPTNLKFPGIANYRQAIVPPVGNTRKYQCYRYGKKVYAVPLSLGGLDIRERKTRVNPLVLSASDVEEMERKLGEEIVDPPILIESYREYNLVRFRGKFFAVLQSLGAMNLMDLDEWKLFRYHRRGQVLVKDTVEAARDAIDSVQYESLREELRKQKKLVMDLQAHINRDLDTFREYREKEALWEEQERKRQVQLFGSAGEYNIIRAGDRFMAFDKALGPRKPLDERLGEKELYPFILVGEQLEEITERANTASLEKAERKRKEDMYEVLVSEKQALTSEYEKKIGEYREKLNAAMTEIQRMESDISRLEGDINDKNTRIQELTGELNQSKNHVEKLENTLMERSVEMSIFADKLKDYTFEYEKKIEEYHDKLNATSVEISNAGSNISRLEGEITDKDTRIQELTEELNLSESHSQSLETTLNEVHGKLNAAMTEIQRVESNISRLEGDITDKNTRVKELTGELNRSQNHSQTLETTLNEVQEKLNAALTEIQHAESDISRLEGDITDKNTRVKELTGELNFLKDHVKIIENSLVDRERVIEKLNQELSALKQTVWYRISSAIKR